MEFDGSFIPPWKAVEQEDFQRTTVGASSLTSLSEVLSAPSLTTLTLPSLSSPEPFCWEVDVSVKNMACYWERVERHLLAFLMMASAFPCELRIKKRYAG